MSKKEKKPEPTREDIFRNMEGPERYTQRDTSEILWLLSRVVHNWDNSGEYDYEQDMSYLTNCIRDELRAWGL